MDYFSFIFSSLLIVSVTTTTYGSVIKANNPNEEVNEELTCVIALDKISVCNPKMAPLLKFPWYLCLFYAMNKLVFLTRVRKMKKTVNISLHVKGFYRPN